MPKDKEEKVKDKKAKVETEDPQAIEFSELDVEVEAKTEAINVETEEPQQEEILTQEVEGTKVENEEAAFETKSTTFDSEEAQEIDADKTVTVQPVKFASFEDLGQTQGEINKNLDILLDIKLQLTVELGRTELPIKKVLELTRGSIIELEKVAGEPVELYANGKLIAHGEVVVIEDNFGLRITSITEPDERLKGI